jgi:signal transduction histidine kinase
MNSIIGFTEKVLRSSQDRLTARELDALATVKRSAHHLLGLINDILDLSKIEAGKMEVEREEVDLRLFIELERTQYTQLAKSAGLDFHLHLPATPLQLHTDRRRLLQILNNLISNAVKYTEQGEVSVSVQQEIHADLGPVVAIHVQDTGLGIRPEDQQRLFREFGRAAEVRQKNIQGTGLGLLISAQLVALLGGRISVHSEHGKGSRFSVFFPMMGS